MYFEFHIFIQTALDEFCSRHKLGQEPQEKILSLLEVEALPELLLKNEKRFALGLSTNIVFKLQKYLEEFNNVRSFLSVELAEEILTISKVGNFYNFETSIGGAGFLNAIYPLTHLTTELACFLFVNEAEFFKINSIINPKFIIKNKLYQERKFEINWHNVLERCDAKDRSDVQALIDLSKQEFTKELRLMLLGVASSKEIDIDVYLQGIKGSENIPWYVEKYFKDVDNYLRNFEFSSSELRQLQMNEVLPVYLQKSFRLLLTFRDSLFKAILYQRPEILFSLLLAMIKEFYKIYNQLKFRFPNINQISEQEKKVIFLLFSQIARLTQISFGFF